EAGGLRGEGGGGRGGRAGPAGRRNPYRFAHGGGRLRRSPGSRSKAVAVVARARPAVNGGSIGGGNPDDVGVIADVVGLAAQEIDGSVGDRPRQYRHVRGADKDDDAVGGALEEGTFTRAEGDRARVPGIGGAVIRNRPGPGDIIVLVHHGAVRNVRHDFVEGIAALVELVGN